jgi:hypothetical protein
VNRCGGYDRKSPLDLAVERGDRGMVGLLVGKGACVPQSALDQATKRKDEKMLAAPTPSTDRRSTATS